MQKSNPQTRKNKRRAFTVVELVIVIAVIAILAVTLIPTFTSIIRKANESKDIQEIHALNVMLALPENEGITSPEVLEAIIETVYGEGAYETFAPKSADHGMHYWYYIKENRVVLMSYEEVMAVQDTMKITESQSYTLSNGDGVALAAEDRIDLFAKSNPFRVFNGHYLLDNTGSTVADAMNALESGENVDKTINDLATMKGNDKDKGFAQAILTGLSEIAIVTPNGTLICGDSHDNVKNIYFALNGDDDKKYTLGKVFLVDITSGAKTENTYIAKAEKVNSINLPSSVETVEENALMFEGVSEENSVLVYTELETVEDITRVFRANSTNATILNKNADQFTIDGSGLKDENGDAVEGSELEYSVKVDSFDIVASAPEGVKFDTAPSKIYVSYDDLSKLTISAENFVGTGGATPSTTEVTWTSDSTEIKRGADGKLIVTPAGENNKLQSTTATITAKAVAGGKEVTSEINVVIVKGANITLGVNTLSMNLGTDNSIDLSYDGTVDSIDFSKNSVEYNYNPLPDVSLNTDLVVTAGEGSLFTVANNKLTFNTSGDFSGSQEITVKVGNYLSKTFTVTVQDNSTTPFEVVFKNTDDYLYRVGNGNTIRLDQLFSQIEGSILPSAGETFKVEIYDITDPSGDGKDYISTTDTDSFYANISSADLTSSAWGSQTIDFGGVGVVEIVIKTRTTEQNLKVEVVNATNVVGSFSSTTISNSVALLSDIESSSRITVSGCTVYGNGFTITDKIPAASTTGVTGFINLKNSTLDNVVVKGQVYPKSVAMGNSEQYYSFCVYVTGTSSNIYNSYISGCSYPVVMEGTTLNIENTTLDGGAVANMRIRAGAVTMKDCITTTATDSTALKSLGILISSADASLTLKGTFTQYNWIEKTQIPSDYKAYFEDIYSNTTYAFSNGGKTYLNMGILCLDTSGTITADEARGKVVIDDINLNYDYIQSTESGITYTCYTQKASDMTADALTIPNKDNITNEAYQQKGQHALVPEYQFNHNTNNVPKETEDQKEYCYYSSDLNKVIIALDPDNPTFTYDPHILSVSSKYGKAMTVNVYFNGSATPVASGSKVTFTEAGEYELVYKFKDTMNFNANGSKYTIDYELTLNFSVTVSKKAEVKVWTPEFSYKDTWAAESEIIIANNKNYVSPVTTDTTNFGTTTVGGKTIKYPKITVNGTNSSGSTYEKGDIYWYAPAFKAINIIDYDKDTGEVVTTYSSSYSQTPSSTVFGYGSTAPFHPQTGADYKKTYNKSSLGGFGYSSQKSSSGSKYTQLVEFWFYDTDTDTYYYYYIEYTFEAQTYVKGSSLCVTPDTLVTLADGTQKRIDTLTYDDQLLVWDFHAGKYVSAPISIIVNHGYDYYAIIDLTFDDGTVVSAVGAHAFFDADVNNWVNINVGNAEEYVGHKFVKVDGDSYKTVELINVSVREEYTESWTFTTYEHFNGMVEGMFSVTPLRENIKFFEVGTDMKYDEAKKQADIETYGLYTYDEFAHILTAEEFDILNVAEFKVSVEKGLCTYEDVLYALKLYRILK